MFEEKNILTVTQLNTILKNLLEEAFQQVYVEGEVSNCKEYSSGHIYFSLKDETSQIQCLIFQQVKKNLKFEINNGMKVVCYGRINLYIPRGEHRLIVYEVIPKGVGALQLAFEQLKQKLQKEGLFDESRKRKIPFLPQKIGVVTSPSGAAIRDIISVIRRRFANVEILLYPVKVQGEGAASDIAEGIRFLNDNFPELEVLLVGRGGGSIEDLWAFNEEVVARAVANSKIPIISCVGHEIDYTITDYVSDLRAPTPSAAAELVVKNKDEIYDKLRSYCIRLQQSIKSKFNSSVIRLKNIINSRVMKRPQLLFEDKLQYVSDIEQKIGELVKNILSKKRHKFELLSQKLNLLSPENILSRGYAIVWENEKVVKRCSMIRRGDNLKIQFFDGKVDAKIK